MPVAATATPENITDLRMPFFRAGSARGPRCFGTYDSRRGTEELTDVDYRGTSSRQTPDMSATK